MLATRRAFLETLSAAICIPYLPKKTPLTQRQIIDKIKAKICDIGAHLTLLENSDAQYLFTKRMNVYLNELHRNKELYDFSMIFDDDPTLIDIHSIKVEVYLQFTQEAEYIALTCVIGPS